MSKPLALDTTERERLLEQVGDWVLRWLDGLYDHPAQGTTGSLGFSQARELSLPFSETGYPMRLLLERLGSLSSLALETAGPGYLAYVPGGGLFVSALADLIANATNRFTGIAAAAPGFARLEHDVLRWLASEFGYGPEGGGILTTGGSQANLCAIVAARERAMDGDADLRRATIYTSTQAHGSIAKSARVAGLRPTNVRLVDVDEALRMSVEALTTLVDEDIANGLEPMMVVAAAGTTNTGAIDPLDALADFCEARGLWLHVDGAYGGAFVLCPTGRERLSGQQRADSITFDPHKGLFLPYGTGCLLVANTADLKHAFGESGVYLADLATSSADAFSGPSEMGPELSRDFRGLRLWLPLMVHGIGPFRATLESRLSLASHLAEQVAQLPVDIAAPTSLTVVAFRAKPPPSSAARTSPERLVERDRRTSLILAEVNGAGRVHLSSTRLPTADGLALTIRACVVSFRTRPEDIEHCVADLRAALERLEAASWA